MRVLGDLCNHWREASPALKVALVGGSFALGAAAIGILPDACRPSSPPSAPAPAVHTGPVEDDPAAPADGNDHFSEGRLAFVQGRYPKAIECYTLVIATQPDFPEAYYERARAYTQVADVEKAMEDAAEFLRLRPDDCRGYRLRGDLYYNSLRDYAKSEADYSKLIQLAHCADPSAYECRGDAYFYQGQYEEAIADYTAALERDPTRLGALRRRGYSYERIGRVDLAMLDHTKALRLGLADALMGQDPGAFREH